MPEPPPTKPLGTPFIELQSVESTNNYAREQLKSARQLETTAEEQNSLHGTAIFAHDQSAGKGQRGKTWQSGKNSNILISLVIKPAPLPLSAQFQLSACVAVAAHAFFTQYAGDRTKIKWPNDLYWQDRKAGGILIENVVRSQETEVRNLDPRTGSQEPIAASPEPGATSIKGMEQRSNWDWSIVGMGININQPHFPASLPNPVSLKQITGKTFDTVTMAKELCGVLDKKFSELMTNGFENIYRQYLANLYKLNEDR